MGKQLWFLTEFCTLAILKMADFGLILDVLETIMSKIPIVIIIISI